MVSIILAGVWLKATIETDISAALWARVAREGHYLFYGDVYSCFVSLRQRTKMLVIPVENSDLSAHLLNRLHFDFHSQSRLLNTHTLLYLQCSLSGLGNSHPSFCSALQNFGCGFEMPRNLLLLR